MRFYPILLVLVLIITGACSSDDTTEPEVLPQTAADAPAEISPALPSLPQIARIVIRDAQLTIMADNPSEAVIRINSLATERGGWVVSSTNRSRDNRANASTTIRVPAATLDQTLDEIRALAEDVESETITGRDVTQEFVDLESQLVNLQRTEEQLQTLLERANTVDDVLTVQTELTRIRGEIETIQGRINFLDESAAFSSIVVSVQSRSQFSQDWNPGGVVADSIDALVLVLQLAVNLLIIFVIVGLPVIVLFVVPGVLAYRYGRRRGWWGQREAA